MEGIRHPLHTDCVRIAWPGAIIGRLLVSAPVAVCFHYWIFLHKIYVRNLYIGTAIMLGLAIVISFFGLRMPFWGIRDLTFFSTVFFLKGYLYKKKYNNWNKGYLSVLFAVIVAIGSIWCYTSMLSFTTDKMLPYAICAICGTVMILNISQYIASKGSWIKNLFVYVGNNTLTVLTGHFLCFKIVSLIIIQYYDLPIEQLAYFPIIPEYSNLWPVYTLAGIGIPLTGKYLWHKIRPDS